MIQLTGLRRSEVWRRVRVNSAGEVSVVMGQEVNFTIYFILNEYPWREGLQIMKRKRPVQILALYYINKTAGDSRLLEFADLVGLYSHQPFQGIFAVIKTFHLHTPGDIGECGYKNPPDPANAQQGPFYYCKIGAFD